jgi:hypothetical protein
MVVMWNCNNAHVFCIHHSCRWLNFNLVHHEDKQGMAPGTPHAKESKFRPKGGVAPRASKTLQLPTCAGKFIPRKNGQGCKLMP